jgi:glucokinase
MEKDLYLGMDVGKSNIGIAIGNDEGLNQDMKRKVSTEEHWSEQGLRDLIQNTLHRYGLEVEGLEGIGICVPGLVDPEEMRMELSFALEELSFTQLSDLDVDLYIENDANAAVMGEKFYGDGGGTESIATVVIGSGVGGGVYYDGELLGAQRDGRSPEPAGILVEGETTWEQALGGEGIPEFIRGSMDDTNISQDIDAEALFDLRESHEEVEKHMNRLKQLNARGIATLVNMYAPGLITFTGAVASNNPEFMKESFDSVESLCINPVPEMKVSDLGSEAGLYGALALAQGLR